MRRIPTELADGGRIRWRDHIDVLAEEVREPAGRLLERLCEDAREWGAAALHWAKLMAIFGKTPDAEKLHAANAEAAGRVVQAVRELAEGC